MKFEEVCELVFFSFRIRYASSICWFSQSIIEWSIKYKSTIQYWICCTILTEIDDQENADDVSGEYLKRKNRDVESKKGWENR